MPELMPMRGRQAELEQLLAAWEDVRRGGVRYVRVSGEPGAGKTRLVQAFYELLRQEAYDPAQSSFPQGYWLPLVEEGTTEGNLRPPYPAPGRRPPMPFFWWALACKQGNQGHSESFAPYWHAMEQWHFHFSSEVAKRMQAEAHGEFAAAMALEIAKLLPIVGPYVGRIADLSKNTAKYVGKLKHAKSLQSENAYTVNATAQQNDKIEDALISSIAALNNSDRHKEPIPLILVLDDVQWIDARSLAFTARLLLTAAEQGWRLLVVATARNNELAAQADVALIEWSGLSSRVQDLESGLIRHAGSDSVCNVELQAELGSVEAGALLRDRLPHASEATIAALGERAGSHPYYLVNYAGLIAEKGWLTADGDLGVDMAELNTIPGDVAALIDARLRLLRPEMREVLNWGSVQGHRFLGELVEFVAHELQQSPLAAKRSLGRLSSDFRLIGATPLPGKELRRYDFAHRLLYERVLAGVQQEEREIVEDCLGGLLRRYAEAGQLDAWSPEERLVAWERLYAYAGRLQKAGQGHDLDRWLVTRFMAAAALLTEYHLRGDNLRAEPLADVVFQQAIGHASTQTATEDLDELLRLCAAVYEIRGRGEEQSACLQRLLELRREVGDESGAAAILTEIGRVHRARGEYDQSMRLFEQSLEARQRLGDEHGAAITLNNMGEVHRLRGSFDEAMEFFQRSLAIEQRLGQEAGAASALKNIGNIHGYRGEYELALQNYELCLEVERRLGDVRGEAVTLNNMGLAHGYRSEYPEALPLYAQSLALQRRLGDAAGVARTLNNLGLIRLARSDYDEAMALFDESLALQRQIGNEPGAAMAMINMGRIHTLRGQYDEALKLLAECIEVQRRTANEHGEAQALHDLGKVELARGRFADALSYFESSLELQRRMGDEPGAADTLKDIGSVHSSRGDFDAAMECYTASLELVRKIGYVQGEAALLNNMANVHRAMGEFGAAMQLFEKSLAIKRELGDEHGTAITLNNIGLVHRARGEHAEALKVYAQCLETERALGDEHGVAKTIYNMGNIHLDRGELDEAKAMFEQCLEVERHLRVEEGQAMTLAAIATVHELRGEFAVAAALLDHSIEIYARLGDDAEATRLKAVTTDLRNKANGPN